MTTENIQLTNEPAPPKKSSFGCLKILAIIGGVIAFLFIVLIILVWQMVSWAKNLPEPAVASYPPLNLSEGEKEDVQRILVKLGSIKQTREVLDEYVSPDVFNGVMEEIIEGEKKKTTKSKHDEPEYFRAGFAGEDLQLKLTKQVEAEHSKQPMYVNIVADFKLEVVDGRVTQLEIDKVLIHDTPPPFLARLWLNMVAKGISQNNNPNAQVNTGWIEAFKLLKREGDKVHFIIDGSKMKD